MKEVNPDELVQYIVVNKDLNMSPGKIAAQVGHACTDCAVMSTEFNKMVTDEDKANKFRFVEWYMGIQKKVVLEAHEKVLLKLEKQGYYTTHDLGLTEIPENSVTAVTLGILTRAEAEPIIKRLQTLK